MRTAVTFRGRMRPPGTGRRAASRCRAALARRPAVLRPPAPAPAACRIHHRRGTATAPAVCPTPAI